MDKRETKPESGVRGQGDPASDASEVHGGAGCRGCLNLCGRDFNRGPLEADNPLRLQRDASLTRSHVTSSTFIGRVLASNLARALDHLHSLESLT